MLEKTLIKCDAIPAMHLAVTGESFESISQHIFEQLDKMSGAENKRIRLVDFTGKRLIPVKREGSTKFPITMAVRHYDEGIIGRVAQKQQTELITDVQKDIDFQKYLTSINEKSQDKGEPLKREWKEYAKYLRKLKSAIIVPIIVPNPNNGKKLIGIINVNSTKKKFLKTDEKTLDYFGSCLSLITLNQRSRTLLQLHEIEERMMIACSWDEVADRIAKGVHKFFPGSVPNIYLFNENNKKNPFTFLCSGANKEERDLGGFKPRWNTGREKGIGETAINTHSFVVVEDVQGNSPAIHARLSHNVQENSEEHHHKGIFASEGARKKGVRTVGCLPLIFHGDVVGVLYLHFKNDIYYFSEEDKTILEMFGHSAAVTIKNVASTPSFRELSGNHLIQYIDDYKSQNDDLTLKTVIHQLKEMTKKLENAKGTTDITQIINSGIFDIGTSLKMPDELFNLNSRFQKYEELILYNIPNYRDHFLHMFFVFSTGIFIIDQWIYEKVPFIGSYNENDVSKLVKTWFICSIMHDVAYPLSQVKKWIPQFPKETLKLDCNFSATFDWTEFAISKLTHPYIDAMSSSFVKGIEDCNRRDKKKNKFKFWLHQQLLQQQDHGALGALTIMNIKWNQDLEDIATDAALATALHNYVKDKNRPLNQLHIKSYPLAFLLTYCDVVQEWGRPTGNIKEDIEVRDIMKRVTFQDISVTNKETKFVLVYNPEQNFNVDLRKMDNDENIIYSKFNDNMIGYNNHWSKRESNHDFIIEVKQSAQEESLIYWYFG
jgi:FOG: GAF domain